jgi:hypothetical protein
MRDGSAVVGTLPEYRLTLNTLHGPVNAYANDVRKIDFAPTNSHDVSSTIALAIHRLGSAQPDEVQSAEGELMAAGARAFQALVAAAQCGKGALQRRARALAARIQQNVAAEFLNLRTQHQVTLRDGTITCALDPFVFGLMTPEGYKSFELYDVHTLTQFPGQAIDAPRDNPRWLGRFYTNWYGAKLSFLVTGNTDDGDVFGSNPYTLDSMLATAAVHAGLVQPGETKVVRVEIMLAPPTFVGSERNGVTSLDWEEPVAGAFRFIE